jgi:hypothetical protein
MTREDLLRLIARAVRRSFTFASEGQALGAADTVLRDLKAVGIRILAPRTRTSSPAKPRPVQSLGRSHEEERAREAGEPGSPRPSASDAQD